MDKRCNKLWLRTCYTNGYLFGWGYNSKGEIGNNTTTANLSSPIQIGGYSTWSKVVKGNETTLAFDTSGYLYAWGDNQYGQCAQNSLAHTSFSSPVQIGATGQWSSIACTYQTCLAINSSSGNLWGWGLNGNYEIGNGTNTKYSSPVQVGSSASWLKVMGGYQHTVAYSQSGGGTVWAWGKNTAGEIGNGTTGNTISTPVQVGTGVSWLSVAAGYAISAGIINVQIQSTSSSSSNSSSSSIHKAPLYTCGSNADGQCGLGATSGVSTPVMVSGHSNWKQIACGLLHTIGIDGAGHLWTFGYNADGECGNGTNGNNITTPVQLGSSVWTAVACSDYASFGITGGKLFSWGYGAYGELGNNSATQKQSSPIQVGALSTWKTLSAGGNMVYGITTGGALWGWGYGNGGRLGNGASANYSSPVQIGALTTWKIIANNNEASHGILTTGALYGWGYNAEGCVGDNTVVDKTTPVQIGAATTWQAVAHGYGQVVAINNGQLYGWGRNSAYQVGNGSNTNVSSPVIIDSNSTWTACGAGWHTTGAIKAGQLYRWGDNSSAQYGNGTTTTASTPVLIGSMTTWWDISAGQNHFVGTHEPY